MRTWEISPKVNSPKHEDPSSGNPCVQSPKRLNSCLKPLSKLSRKSCALAASGHSDPNPQSQPGYQYTWATLSSAFGGLVQSIFSSLPRRLPDASCPTVLWAKLSTMPWISGSLWSFIGRGRDTSYPVPLPRPIRRGRHRFVNAPLAIRRGLPEPFVELPNLIRCYRHDVRPVFLLHQPVV
jgi:hypothetical protein